MDEKAPDQQEEGALLKLHASAKKQQAEEVFYLATADGSPIIAHDGTPIALTKGNPGG